MKRILGFKLYNKKEAAELLGIQPNTVTLYESQGRIKGTVIGGRKYYTEEAIKDFLFTPWTHGKEPTAKKPSE